MKKRRTLIIAMLLIAALTIGIGYAAISGALVIDGKVVANAQPFNMHFVAFTAGESTSELTNVPAMACPDLDNGAIAKSVTLNINGMASVGDTIEGTLTIQNQNDCNMNVKVESILYGASAGTVVDSASEYFEVSTTWGTETKTIAPDGRETIKVIVKMIKSCTAAYEGYFRIAINGVSAE